MFPLLSLYPHLSSNKNGLTLFSPLISFRIYNMTYIIEIYVAFPWIVLTLLERLFNDFLLITVYCTEFLYFFT